MHCKIKWNSLSPAQWEERFAKVRRSTLLQSYDYACAACPFYGQSARWGLILIDGEEAGLVQILEAGILRGALHAMILDRGPLWFAGFGTREQRQEFYETLNRQFPARLGRRRRIIPENDEGGIAPGPGFRKLSRPPYRTIWLDLTQSRDDMLAAMKPQWRNKLRKAEKAGLRIEWDETGAFLDELLTNYQSDKVQKGYDGPSPALLKQLAKVFIPRNRFMIVRALADGKKTEEGAAAAIMLLCHGTSATYQVGWSVEEGRKTAAHNLLLWQAACMLKDRGFHDFDLGGINEDGQGLAQFKEGMGGRTVSCGGHYI